MMSRISSLRSPPASRARTHAAARRNGSPAAPGRPGSGPPSPLAERRVGEVRRWIYLYLFLLVFEGVLRKWLFGGVPLVSWGLLVVRDPVAVMIYLLAWRAEVFSRNLRAASWLVLGGFSVLGMLQLLANPELSFWVVLYGVRTYCLHVPLIFVMAEVLTGEDLQRIGRWLLLLAGPMAALMVAQFLAPPDAFINRGTIGEFGQIGSALGRIRPAGTFSYNTGAESFNLLVAAFLLYAFVQPGWVGRGVKWTALVALVAVLPVSGSRGFVLSLGLLIAFALVGGIFHRRLLRVTLVSSGIGAGVFFLLTFTPFFREGLQTFATRWDQALGESGSVNEAIVQRFFGEFIRAFQSLAETPLLGNGLGLGSNVGTALSMWAVGFLLAESEWERTVLEMGPVVAILWLGARCALGAWVVRRAWVSLRRRDPLAWLLFGTECTAIFNGSMAQPTSLGFLVFTTGLCLAAARAGERGEGRPARRVRRRPVEAAA